MKYTVSFTDLTADEARHLINQAGGQAPSVATQTPPPGQVPPPPRPAAPPPGTPAAPPPPPPATAVAPPPPAAAPANPLAVKHKEALDAMQAYAKVHKSAGAKAVLAQINAVRIQDVTDPAQLEWLIATFKAGAGIQ